jgi:hypothetical protein
MENIVHVVKAANAMETCATLSINSKYEELKNVAAHKEVMEIQTQMLRPRRIIKNLESALADALA